MNITDLPFNQHLGVEKQGEVLSLRKRPELLNHVGSIHATAIYGLAEAASGNFIIANLMPHFPDALALAREGSIQYKRPVESDCSAEVQMDDESVAVCIAALKEKGRATLLVPVRIFCDGKVAATAEFNWWFGIK